MAFYQTRKRIFFGVLLVLLWFNATAWAQQDQGVNLQELEKRLEQLKKEEAATKRAAQAAAEKKAKDSAAAKAAEEARARKEQEEFASQQAAQRQAAENAALRDRCLQVCSRRNRECESDASERCERDSCSNAGGYGLGGLGSLLQCKQDADRDYRDCVNSQREARAQCPIDYQDCQEDCRFKYR